MGSHKWADRHFGQRVKVEREHRRWSQADMAKKLSALGIHPMHPTTIAKIEAGDRSVRINEAVGIAELFEVSLDSLLGLKWWPQQSDVTYTLRVLRAAAQQVGHQLKAAADTFNDQLDRLDDIPVDIDADDGLRPILGESEAALADMKSLHRLLAEIARRCDQLMEREDETMASEAESRDEKKRKRRDDALAQRPQNVEELRAHLERLMQDGAL
jgi:transcriptional regulator with XRE-family HTH domain